MSNKTRLYIKKIITLTILLIAGWFFLSAVEISGHNHATLYGIDKPYSEWNIIVLFSDTLRR